MLRFGTAPCRPVVSCAWMRSSARSLNAETDDRHALQPLLGAPGGDDDLAGRGVLPESSAAVVASGAGACRRFRVVCAAVWRQSRSRDKGRGGNGAEQSGACRVDAHSDYLPLAGDPAVAGISIDVIMKVEPSFNLRILQR